MISYYDAQNNRFINCSNDGIWALKLTSSIPTQFTYQWSTGETTASISPSPSQTTTYYVTVNNGITSCQDSVVVTVNPTLEISIDSTSCDSIFWAGDWLTSSRTYNDTLQNIGGCDSIVTLNLTIHNAASSDTTATACVMLITWRGVTYTSSGTYYDTLQTQTGCDSVVTLNLTINNSTSGDTTATACDSFDWYGNTYTSTGTYSETLQTINGCDSVVDVELNNKYLSIFFFLRRHYQPV